MSRTLTLARLRTASASEALERTILEGEPFEEIAAEWSRAALEEIELRLVVERTIARLEGR